MKYKVQTNSLIFGIKLGQQNFLSFSYGADANLTSPLFNLKLISQFSVKR